MVSAAVKIPSWFSRSSIETEIKIFSINYTLAIHSFVSHLGKCQIPVCNTWHIFGFAVKISTFDPKSRLKELSREVAQRAGEVRGMHPSRREPDRSGQRRPESRYRGKSHIHSTQINRCNPAHTHNNDQALWYKRLAFPFLQPLCNLRFGSNVSERGLSADVHWSLASSHSLRETLVPLSVVYMSI